MIYIDTIFTEKLFSGYVAKGGPVMAKKGPACDTCVYLSYNNCLFGHKCNGQYKSPWYEDKRTEAEKIQDVNEKKD